MKHSKFPGYLSAIFLLLGLTFSGVGYGQSGSVSKSSKSKKAASIQPPNKKPEENKKTRGFDTEKNREAQQGETVVRPMEFFGESEPLSDLAKIPQPPIGKNTGKIMKSDREPILEDVSEPPFLGAPDSFLQTETLAPAAASQVASFDGPGTGLAGFILTGAPPDTTMAVGPNHVVAWVNSQYAIFNKTGTVLLGPVNGSALFAGLGNVCETTNRGDPILQYDRLAGRWILSQFAFNTSGGNPIAPYLQCIAVSTTSDPTGTYYRYVVTFGSTSPEGFNDYGKLGVWNDAYYIAYNIFGGSPAGGNTGVSLCASDRTKMLAGDPTATTLCAPTAFYGGGASFLPADLDGVDLPTDTTRGGAFIRYSTALALRMLRLKPNFAASTVTITDGFGGANGSFVNFPTGSTTLPCNGTGGTCVAQPATSNTLDTLGSRLMYRLAYRNRGGVDSMLVTQSVDPDGAGARSSAIRWYEIRNPLGDPNNTNTGLRPFIYQNGTFDPGAAGDRWMGSVAMNKNGSIMAGYSLVNASAALKPSIAVAGRFQGDTLNTLQSELIALTGTGSQTGTLTRWGDYSTMQIDPADDLTFWFTTQYLSADGTFNWRTRVVAYRFPATTAVADGDFNASINWNNGVPNATTSGSIPAGRTVTVNTPASVANLTVETGGALVMNSNLTVSGSLTLNSSISTGSNVLILGCNATVSLSSSSVFVTGNIRKEFCQTGAFSFPTGTASGFSPLDVNITALTTNPSSLEVRSNQGNRAGMDAAQSAHRFWSITETGDLTANLLFHYLDSDINGTESAYKLYRFVGNAGSAVTPFTLNTISNTISTNGITTFSDWATGNLAPTAANVSVAGVVRANGRSVGRALVVLTDQQGNSRTIMTNNFGYFRFADVQAGEDYLISVSAKGLQFTPQLLTVSDDISGLELIGFE